jgi:hypothetical protein
MRFGLVWWKDSTLEALAMLPSNGEHSNAANVGDPSEFDYVYRAVNCRPYEPYVRYRLPYRWTFGIVTTVAGIRPVVNHILPYFDGRKRPSDGSQYSK